MNNAYIAVNDDRVARFSGAQAVVGIFVIREELVVERADCVEGIAANVHTRAKHALNHAHAGELPNVFFIAANLPAPQRIGEHVGTGVRQATIRCY